MQYGNDLWLKTVVVNQTKRWGGYDPLCDSAQSLRWRAMVRRQLSVSGVIDDQQFVTACQQLRSSESATIGWLSLHRHASLIPPLCWVPQSASWLAVPSRPPQPHQECSIRAARNSGCDASIVDMTLHTNSQEAPRSHRSGQTALAKHSTQYISNKSILSHLQSCVSVCTSATNRPRTFWSFFFFFQYRTQFHVYKFTWDNKKQRPHWLLNEW